MFHLIRSVGFRDAATAETPGLVASLAIAELFFHFHSFVLECLAFLVVWYGLSWLGWKVRTRASAQ